MELDYSIVAFVDILGFSEMVANDCQNKSTSIKFFEVLREVNKETRQIGSCNITQFSDSVIFSLPLSEDNFIKIIDILIKYQKKLLHHAILCRGAVAFGKHYKEDDFIFSEALIEAYQLESNNAIYPRIILSKNLIEYFRPSLSILNGILEEKDGFFFIDYLNETDEEEFSKPLNDFNTSLHDKPRKIKEKYYWLYAYWEYKFKKKLPFSIQKFKNIQPIT